MITSIDSYWLAYIYLVIHKAAAFTFFKHLVLPDFDLQSVNSYHSNRLQCASGIHVRSRKSTSSHNGHIVFINTNTPRQREDRIHVSSRPHMIT